MTGGQSLHGAVGGGQQQGRLPVCQCGERGHALRDHFLMRRERVVRQHLGVGKVNQPQPVSQKELQQSFKSVGVLFVIGDQDGETGVRQRSTRRRQGIGSEVHE